MDTLNQQAIAYLKQDEYEIAIMHNKTPEH